jgi:hypothetical protein
LWAGSPAARAQITVIGMPNCLKYYVPFIVYKWFTNVAAGCIIQLGESVAARGPRVTDLWRK